MMARLLVDDQTFERELARWGQGKIENFKGRGKGNREIPEVLRKVIGESALEEGSKEVAAAFGVSKSSVDAYKNGATSSISYNEPDEDLKNHIDNKRLEISGKAKGRLLKALEEITDEKLEGSGVKTLAGVARDMSAIVRNIEPDPKVQGGNNVQFVFFAPHLKREQDFDIIPVQE